MVLSQSTSIIPLYNVFMPPDVINSISTVLKTGQIAGGPNVAKFEKLLGDYIGNPLITTTGDISSSLILCLFLAGIRPEDDVLMSPIVCLATSCPVRNLFANIRWCDVDPATGNLDPVDMVKKITPQTKAIVVYHWAGNPADLDAIHSVARSYNLAVIEDAGEAIGAEYHRKKIGATGSNYAVFSFYPNRHLTTIEGAAIACAREEDYEKVLWLKRYGIHQPSFRDKDGEINQASDIPDAGWNTYMNHVAATIGVAQMEHIHWIVSRYRENGLYYDRTLAEIPGVSILQKPDDSLSAFWVYTFLAHERDRLLKYLHKKGVQASKVHMRNDIYSCFGDKKETLPGVDEFCARCLSVPCGWWVDEEKREYIVEVLRSGW